MKTMKITTALLLLLFITANMRANDSELITGEITGRVIDGSSQQPIAYASVALLNAEDLSLVTGVISNDEGEYSINKVPKGNYKLKVTLIEYKTKMIDNISISRGQRKIE